MKNKDKYCSMFSCQIEAIVLISVRFENRGISLGCFPVLAGAYLVHAFN